MLTRSLEPRSHLRWTVFFASLSLALGLALLWALLQRPDLSSLLAPESRQRLLDDPRYHGEIVAELVSSAWGFWDSHSDPSVGRVLQPSLRGKIANQVAISTNACGMREREYALPKPAGLLRVVLLGDSLVLGWGCPQDQRMGVFLERFLEERARDGHPEIEVLHLAVDSWNVLAECEYLRRQLSLLRPDLVFHLTTNNDTDDVQGTRGFGVKARFTDLHRLRADVQIQGNYPRFALNRKTGTPLIYGVDWEGRERLRVARAAVLRLRAAIEAQGGRYVMVLHWSACAPAAGEQLVQGFPPRQLAVLTREFWNRQELWVADQDPHWNPEGMREVAELLYGLIQRRALLPGLALPSAPEADRMVDECETSGLELLGQGVGDAWLEALRIDARVDALALAQEEPGHFHGGIDAQGRLGPYASLLLVNHRARALAVRGRGLERPEIDGLVLKVYADEVLLHEFAVRAGQPFAGRWPLPPEFDRREAIDARFEASDYAYVGEDLQHCVSVQLESVALLSE